ncbi:histone [Comamonas thiooxydans]|jgi:DNA-binding protein H-NS|uniref:Histone n=3 Tax=Comamonadaceae TaxID=80864 RepID=A0A096G8D4_COMTE|nr:histone [Comamonas thiooxydans]KGH13805.1 histone [Comamonas thiooxydans]KGH30903.1 histone [Comamonas testosteroni]GAO73476.1 histone [Comamonas sp. E6]
MHEEPALTVHVDHHLGHTYTLMKSYSQLKAELAQLDKQIAQARASEETDALIQVRELVQSFGFTVHQVFPLPQPAKKEPVARYYDPDTGQSWSGRGKPPRWIDGKDRSLFEIDRRPTYDFNAPRDERNPFPVQ